MRKATFTALTLLTLATPALAADPYGVWRRPEDGTTFSFLRCGAGLCVKVKGVTDPADRKFIGAMVFSGAGKTGPNVWEGRVKNLEWHSPSGRTPKAGSREAEAVDTLLSAASVARFEPARVQGGLPIAVNMIWLVANTTVRGSKPAFEAPPAELPQTATPAPRKRRVNLLVSPKPAVVKSV